MRNLRNVAIVLLAALIVAFVPGGGNAADTVMAAIAIAFLSAISWAVYAAGRRNQLTLSSLSDGRRAILYGALGLIALLIAGNEELFATGIGTLAWLLLVAAAAVAIWRVWVEASSY